MKIHANLVSAISVGLKEIFNNGQQADQVVERLFSANKKWGGRDRKFVAENIYHIARYRRLYEYCSGAVPNDEGYALKLLATKLVVHNQAEPDELLQTAGLHKYEIAAKCDESKGMRRIEESIPDWLDDLGMAEIGDNWANEIKALNQQANFSVRVNTLKTNKDTVVTLFNNEGIDCTFVDDAPDAVVTTVRKNVKNNIGYRNGFFEIQDVSSQLVAPMLDVKSGMVVVDACAGGGGKALHAATLMGNNGKIIAMDINEHKLGNLEARARRAGVSIIETRKATENNVAALNNRADRLLLDVPCSGLGVLRRKPDAKWHLSPLFLEEIKNTQGRILNSYSQMLRIGGIMVYSTCSILPSENELQVEKFLDATDGRFILLQDKKVSPYVTGHDGFYMAKLQRVS